jgi:hypothetical protein
LPSVNIQTGNAPYFVDVENIQEKLRNIQEKYIKQRIVSNLPRSITSLKNEKTQFEIALKKVFICTLLLLCG